MQSYIETPQGAKFLKQYLDKFNGKSSQKIYKSESRQFFKFYRGTLANLGKKDFTRYLNHLGKTSKAKTIKRKFSILNQFFKFLEIKVKGFVSPIGKNHGDMQDFRGGTYIESESFRNQVDNWVDSLICDSTKRTYRGAVGLFFAHTGKDLKVFDLTYDLNPKIWLGIDLLASYVNLRPMDLLKLHEADVDVVNGELTFHYPTKRKNKLKKTRLLDHHINIFSS